MDLFTRFSPSPRRGGLAQLSFPQRGKVASADLPRGGCRMREMVEYQNRRMEIVEASPSSPSSVRTGGSFPRWGKHCPPDAGTTIARPPQPSPRTPVLPPAGEAPQCAHWGDEGEAHLRPIVGEGLAPPALSRVGRDALIPPPSRRRGRRPRRPVMPSPRSGGPTGCLRSPSPNPPGRAPAPPWGSACRPAQKRSCRRGASPPCPGPGGSPR